MNSQPQPDILWDYMDRLRWRLRRLPEEQNADILREIRQHMQDLVADYQAEGASPAEAVRLAEEKFGSAEKVGDRLVRQRYGWPAILFILRIFLLSISMSITSNEPGEIAAAIGLGIGVGLAGAIEIEACGKWIPSPLRKRQEYVWITIGVLVLLAVIFFRSWPSSPGYLGKKQTEWSGIWTVAVLVSYGITAAIRKYGRRARL